MKRTDQQLERMMKAVANHRRIQILRLLKVEPDLTLMQISDQLQMDQKSASEHTRRLAAAGLVLKQSHGKWVNHTLTDRGETLLEFIETLD